MNDIEMFDSVFNNKSSKKKCREETFTFQTIVHPSYTFPFDVTFNLVSNRTRLSDLQCYEKEMKYKSKVTDSTDLEQLEMFGPCNSFSLEPIEQLFMKGTTTLGFIYKNGIILATDSRATANNMVVTQTLNKVIPVSKSILSTLAGNAGDCVYWLRSLAKQCELWKIKYKEEMRVKQAANLLVNMANKYRGMERVSKFISNLGFGILMAQYDKIIGPQLHMVDNSGVILEGKKFSVGSGSEYAKAILETDYRPDLNDVEAFALATSAIYHACRRDIHSGGFVRVYKVNQDGWRQVVNKDVDDIYYERHNTPKIEKHNSTRADVEVDNNVESGGEDFTNKKN